MPPVPGSESPAYPPTPRTRLKRRASRGTYDRAVVHAILDEGLVCHVGVTVDGTPMVLPTAYARLGEAIYLHGSTANRMLRAACSGATACITVTLVDGLVLARSAFHHSMNYRSVLILARGEKVTDPAEHERALHAVVEHVVPGRSPFVRAPNREEIAQTLVVRFPLVEVSAKVRSGAPIDDEADMELETWAGVLPLALRVDTAQPDPLMRSPTPIPNHVSNWRRP